MTLATTAEPPAVLHLVGGALPPEAERRAKVVPLRAVVPKLVAAPGLGGAFEESSGGTNTDGGLRSDAGNGGRAATGKLPEQPFLPGCYCAAAPAAPSRSAPLWPTLLGAVVSLRGIARARRNRRSPGR